MTVTGGFPAPGPQDREPMRDPGDPPPPSQGPRLYSQAPMLSAYRPGIVALRPLSFGDILDGAVRAVRYNPKSMVGLAALVLGAFLVPSAALGSAATHLAATSGNSLGPAVVALLGVLPTLLQIMSTILAAAVLSGLLMHVVGQAVLGRKPDIGQTWRTTRGRLPAVLGLSFLSGLFTVLSSAVLIGPGVLVLRSGNTAGGVILLLFGTVGLLAAALAFSAKISMAAPAVVLEGHGVVAGLRRSFALTRGPAFWRVLGITLVASILAGIAGSILQFPLTLLGLGIAAIAGQDTETGLLVVTFVSHVSALLSGSVTTPFAAAVTGLLYIDRRMRLEALDVVLLRQVQAGAGPWT